MRVLELTIAGSGIKGRGRGILEHDGKRIPFRISGGASLAANGGSDGEPLPLGAEKVILQAHNEEQLRRVEDSYRKGGCIKRGELWSIK